MDFAQPITIKAIAKNGAEKTYSIGIAVFTGLPMVFINTENNIAIDQKVTYIDATFQMYENNSLSKSSDVIEEKIGIRGRGNSTWTMPKKPYKIKFENKVSFWGLAEHKHWVLLADYSDKTLIRNQTALFMGQLSDLDWTPSGKHVDVFINEKYQGVYFLCEQVKDGKGRVNIGKDGYLLEIDARVSTQAGDVYFTNNLITWGKRIAIKEPAMAMGDEKYIWIRTYFEEFTDALFNPDSDKNVYDYIDVDSFVDWYLINEITKNNDAVDATSCYLNIIPGGRLKRGPLWDFDISLGNINYNNNQDPTGFWITQGSIYGELMKDPTFIAAVKERFKFYKSKKDEIFQNINLNAANLEWAIIENNAKWKNLYTPSWPNYAVWGSYDNEIAYMKEWFNRRFEWLDKALSEL